VVIQEQPSRLLRRIGRTDFKVLRDRPYLDYLRTQRCVLTGRHGNDNVTVDPAHFGTGGTGIKADDSTALPLLHWFHHEAHQRGHASLLRQHASDSLLMLMACAYAREMYRGWKDG